MKTIWNMINRPGQSKSPNNFPVVEDNEILFSKNNVCVHPCTPNSSPAPYHSLGYLTVTAAPDPTLGHTLLLSWRPNQLMLRGSGTGGRGQHSLSETQPATSQCLGTGDAGLCHSQPSSITCEATEVAQSDSGAAACNGVAEVVAQDTADGDVPHSTPPRLDLPAASEVCQGDSARGRPAGTAEEEEEDRGGGRGRPAGTAEEEEDRGRLSARSAPPSPRPRPPASEAPDMFTMDLGRARSVRVFLTPDDPGCGQLVLCSRQSQYRILHFHCGGLERIVRLFDGWKHLRSAEGTAYDGGCRLFSVCSPVVEEGGDHPEEGHYDCLTADVWRGMTTTDGRVTDPDQLRQVVFFGGLEPALRPAIWPLLLGVLSGSASAQQRQEERSRLQREFQHICGLPDQMSPPERAEFHRLVVSTVDKDVVRTDPANPFFCGRANPNVQTLRRILLGFAAANPSVGYSQGMSDLLAPLLVTLGSPSDAYWALDALIKRSAAVICPRDDVMDVQLGYLRELLRLLTPQFYNHLAAVEDGLELLFTHRWLLLCFKREFPEPSALQIWEACWSCRQTRHFSLFVCAAICAAYAADVTDSAMNADAILLHFTSLSQHMDGEVVLRKARGLLHRFLSLDAVPCSLAGLCAAGGGPWDCRRVAPVVCGGHTDGGPCPAR